MKTKKLEKPDNLSENTWRQHLRWMNVMNEQVEENFSQHLARVKEDADRCEALWEQHRAALRSKRGQRGNKSLFDT